MKTTTLYKKEGRRYVPVQEAAWNYQIDWAWPQGTHLMCVLPGIRACRYNVEPAYADVLAVIELHRERLQAAVSEAAKLKPVPARQPWGPRQRAAWDRFVADSGLDFVTTEGGCARDMVDALRDEIVKAINARAV